MNKFHITSDRVEQARKWLKERGGIAVWKSVNLSNPGASWSTPATIRRIDLLAQTNAAPSGDGEDILPYPKPNWQCEEKPTIYTDPADIIVDCAKLFKVFHVAVRQSGFSVKLTNASSEKVRRQVEACTKKTGKDAWYEFDYENQNACILYADKQVGLNDYTEPTTEQN